MNKNKNQVEDFIYIDSGWYKRLFDANTFYILGTKGSGKTLYAAICAQKSETARFLNRTRLMLAIIEN